ncbi:Peroxidase [Mycena venus]|uniref:Peroxidase n=1 Tax=Mycena venus TaxID=2733690 RepID=A0A8H6YD22_9AGAR|nr:Peroxidase [Mycena venus]
MIGLALFGLLGTTHAYIWPSPKLDALESLRFDLDKHALAAFLRPYTHGAAQALCVSPEVLNLAQAYHDMATHNVADRTGGMDGSIRLEEQSRAENAGDGFSNTLTVVFSVANRYISVADAFAIAAIMAIENWWTLYFHQFFACTGTDSFFAKSGGPDIAFRGGRVDAAEANQPGVPEPQQDIDSHIASFARQRFTQSKMIGLVACGHTFGGVQHDTFPDIVPELNDPTSTKSVAHFDSTNVNFDHLIATEYISGTTQNPLVVGFNDTTNSDKRIFGSDGNATMLAFVKDPDLFATTCANLFTRMLDTVPNGVQLTEVITPLPVKPDSVILTLNNNTLELSGRVRLWNMTEDADRTVRILWDDHAGDVHNATLPFDNVDTNLGRTPSAWYNFFPVTDTPFISLDPVAGITTMRFPAVNHGLDSFLVYSCS